MALNDAEVEDGVTVYNRSLAWLRRNYPDIPTTVIYIPSPAAIYRHANSDAVSRDVYEPQLSRKEGDIVKSVGRTFAVTEVYAHSQRICNGIRAATLNNGAGFVDARPVLRAAASRQPVHGPRDWDHPNEVGYRVIGTLVAQHLGDRPAEACDDRWPKAAPQVD